MLIADDELFTPLQGGNWHVRWYQQRNELIGARSYQVNGVMVASSLLSLGDGTWTNASDHVLDPRKGSTVTPVNAQSRGNLTVPPWALDVMQSYPPPAPLPNMVVPNYGWDMSYNHVPVPPPPSISAPSEMSGGHDDDDMEIDDDHVVKAHSHVPRPPPVPYHVPPPHYPSYSAPPRRPLPPRHYRSREQLQTLLPTLTSPVPALILPNLDEYQARDVFKLIEPFEPVVLFLEQHAWYIAFLTSEARDQAMAFMNHGYKVSRCYKLIPEKERRPPHSAEHKSKYRPRNEDTSANGHNDSSAKIESKNSAELDERQVLNLLLRDLKTSTWQQVHRMVIENTVGHFVEAFIKSHLSKRVSLNIELPVAYSTNGAIFRMRKKISSSARRWR